MVRVKAGERALAREELVRMSPSAETVPLLVERDAAPDARDGETSAVASRRGRASRVLFIAAGSSPRSSQLARLAPQCAPYPIARAAPRGVSSPETPDFSQPRAKSSVDAQRALR